MRLLITGGAGCLGSNLVEYFLPQGFKILVIDNFETGKRHFLPESHPHLQIIEGSVADFSLMEQAFSSFQPTHIIHSAASYKDPNNWLADIRVNVEGSINVAMAAKKISVQKIINFQTALCYGRPQQVPIPVHAPMAPFTSYGISKTAGEQFLMMSGLPCVSLRLANITGPRLAVGPIPTFYTRLKEKKSCFCSATVRDFLDMEDFFSLVEIVLRQNVPSDVYNVSTGKGHSIKDVFEVVRNYLGVELEDEVSIVPPNDDDVPVVVLDPRETEVKLGWKSKVPFEESLRRTMEWYDRYGVGAVFSHLKPGNVEN